MTEPIDPAFVTTATEVVLCAGDIQLAHFGQTVKISKKGPIDLVTEVDVKVETMFRQLMAERFPSHAVQAEELSSEDRAVNARSPYCWVFDPLDGTVNYAHGLPIFCASLALEIDGTPHGAAVYDPVRQELYTAQRGAGACLNGVPIRVSSAESLVDAMLCTGFPYDVHNTADEVIGLFGAFVGRARAVRRLGSAALDLCYVAAGRLDGFWEQRLHPWDVAAGALLITEAGGWITNMRGRLFQSREGEVLASNGRIHDAMMEPIQAFRAARSRN